MNIYTVEIWDNSCSDICTATLKYRQTNSDRFGQLITFIFII